MTERILISTAGSVETWTINRPDAGNAITGKDVIAAF